MDSKQQLIQSLKQFQDEYNIYPQLSAAAAKLCYRLETSKSYPPELEQCTRRISAEFRAANIASDLTQLSDHFGPHYVFGIGSKVHFKVPIEHDFKDISAAINRATTAPSATAPTAHITFRPACQSSHQLCAYTLQGDIENLTALAEKTRLKVIPIMSTADGHIKAQLVADEPFDSLGAFIMGLQKIAQLASEYKCTINENKHLSLNNSHEVIGVGKIERLPHCLASLPAISADPLIDTFVGVQAKFSDFKGDILICIHSNHVDSRGGGWHQLGYFLSETKQAVKKSLQDMIRMNVQANGFNLTPNFIFVNASLLLTFLNVIANLIAADVTASPDLARLLPEHQQEQEQHQLREQLD